MIGNIIFFLVVVCLQGVTPTPLEQLTPGFIGAVGNDVTCTWEVPRTSLVVGQKSRVTLSIRGAVNPEQISLQEGMIAHPLGVYQVLSTERIKTVDSDGVSIQYQFDIIPNAAGTLSLPSFAYLVFRPCFPEGSRFNTRYLEALVVIVEPALTSRSQPSRSIPSELLQGDHVFTSSWPIESILLPILCAPWLMFLLRHVLGERSQSQERNHVWHRRIRRATTAAELQHHMMAWWHGEVRRRSHTLELQALPTALVELFDQLDRYQYDMGTKTNLAELKAACAILIQRGVPS